MGLILHVEAEESARIEFLTDELRKAMIFSSAVLIVDDLVNPLEGDTKRGSERLHRFPGAVSTADQIVSLCNGERFIRLRGSDIELLQNSLNRLCEPFRCGTVSRLYIPIGAKSGAALNPMDQAARLLLAALYREKHTPRPELFFTERNAEIRKRHASGETLEELSKAFGVSVQRIHQIVHRRNR